MSLSVSSHHHPIASRRRALKLPFGTRRFLAAFEGLEGGFAIGASIIVALSFAGMERHILLMTALISIIVTGFNSASVKYSSEHYLDQLDGREKRSRVTYYFMPAFIEFVAYFAISFISIVPLLLIDSLQLAIVWSCVTTLITLFCAGWWRAYILHMPKLRDAIETTILGAGIIFVGVVSGFALYL